MRNCLTCARNNLHYITQNIKIQHPKKGISNSKAAKTAKLLAMNGHLQGKGQRTAIKIVLGSINRLI